MATELKKITELPTKASVDLANDHVVLNNGESSYQMQMQKIVDAALAQAVKVNTENVYAVAFSSKLPRLIRPSELYKFSSTYIVGVAVNYGAGTLIVALDESNEIPWSSSVVLTTGFKDSQRNSAMCDMAGKANTTAMLAKTECQGVNTAAGFCHTYSKYDDNDGGLPAGRWFVPSLAQELIVYFNYDKINYMISLLGGTPLKNLGVYWTSSQATDNEAWMITFSDGVAGYQNKANQSHLVRPVAFL